MIKRASLWSVTGFLIFGLAATGNATSDYGAFVSGSIEDFGLFGGQGACTIGGNYNLPNGSCLVAGNNPDNVTFPSAPVGLAAGTISNSDGSSLSGQASLLTGDLALEAHARPFNAPVFDLTGPIAGTTMFWDTLTFHGASAGAVGIMDMAGTASSIVTDDIQTHMWATLVTNPVHFDIPDPLFNGGGNVFLANNGPWSISSTFDIVNDRPMMFLASLAIETAGDFKPADVNVFDPITLTLPSGVTFESASGVFLQGSSVPEPSTWLLLGSALVGLAAWRRKHAA